MTGCRALKPLYKHILGLLELWQYSISNNPAPRLESRHTKSEWAACAEAPNVTEFHNSFFNEVELTMGWHIKAKKLELTEIVW